MEDGIRMHYELTPERHFCKDCKYSKKDEKLLVKFSPVCTKKTMCFDFAHGFLIYESCISKNVDGLCAEFEPNLRFRVKKFFNDLRARK